jgi:hypothetical protein
MATRHPIEYKVSPDQIDRGVHWLTLRLKNLGDDSLTELGVRLHSMDDYSIAVAGEGTTSIPWLPGKRRRFPIGYPLT